MLARVVHCIEARVRSCNTDCLVCDTPLDFVAVKPSVCNAEMCLVRTRLRHAPFLFSLYSVSVWFRVYAQLPPPPPPPWCLREPNPELMHVFTLPSLYVCCMFVACEQSRLTMFGFGLDIVSELTVRNGASFLCNVTGSWADPHPFCCYSLTSPEFMSSSR